MKMEFWAEDTGALQCSTEFLSHFCRWTGHGPTTARNGGSTQYKSFMRITLPAGSVQPVIAVRIDGGYTAAFVGNQSVTGTRTFATNAPPGTNFNYWIFEPGESLPAPDPNAAVVFWDELTGVIKFSSDYFPLIVMDVLVGGGQRNYGNEYTLATAQGVFGGQSDPGEGICLANGVPVPDDGNCDSYRYNMQGYVHGGKISPDGRTAYFDQILWDNATIDTTGVPPSWYVPGEVMVIDVTDIPLPATFF